MLDTILAHNQCGTVHFWSSDKGNQLAVYRLIPLCIVALVNLWTRVTWEKKASGYL